MKKGYAHVCMYNISHEAHTETCVFLVLIKSELSLSFYTRLVRFTLLGSSHFLPIAVPV